MTEQNTENFEPQIIKTQDENGKEHDFELIDIITVGEQDYGLLLYIDGESKPKPTEGEEVEEEVVVMRLQKSEEGYTFESIEDEEEFNKVVEQVNLEAEEVEE